MLVNNNMYQTLFFMLLNEVNFFLQQVTHIGFQFHFHHSASAPAYAECIIFSLIPCRESNSAGLGGDLLHFYNLYTIDFVIISVTMIISTSFKG